MGFPGGSEGKASAYNAGDPGSIPGSGRSPGVENDNPFLPGESYGQRSLVGYSPWGRKELDTTERLHFTSAIHRKRNSQGCMLSPCLFNLYAEYIMQNARMDEAQAGIKIAGKYQ